MLSFTSTLFSNFFLFCPRITQTNGFIKDQFVCCRIFINTEISKTLKLKTIAHFSVTAPRFAYSIGLFTVSYCAVVSSPIRLSVLELSIDCAIGCALVPLAEADADELIRQAQTAARAAKQSNQLEIYQAGEPNVARQRFFIESH